MTYSAGAFIPEKRNDQGEVIEPPKVAFRQWNGSEWVLDGTTVPVESLIGDNLAEGTHCVVVRTPKGWRIVMAECSFSADTPAIKACRISEPKPVPVPDDAEWVDCTGPFTIQQVLPQPSPCPDCRGTGEYQGLASVEPCRTCGGRVTT